MLSAAEARIVLTTAGSREEAERIAHALLDERLAACVNIVPGLISVYRWQGAVESAPELLLIIKTTRASLDSLEVTLRRLHSYEVPELLVLTPESASQPYLEWLFAQISVRSPE